MKTILNIIYPNQNEFSTVEKLFAFCFLLPFMGVIAIGVISLVFGIIIGQADVSQLN